LTFKFFGWSYLQADYFVNTFEVEERKHMSNTYNSVMDLLKALLKSNTSPELLLLVIKLLKLESFIQDDTLPKLSNDELISKVNINKVMSSSAHTQPEYIDVKLLLKLSERSSLIPVKQNVITNAWLRAKNLDIGKLLSSEDVLAYVGNSKLLKDAIANSAPFWDTRADTVPLTIFMPTNVDALNGISDEKFLTNEQSWDVINFSKKQTQKLVSTQDGIFRFLGVLQLLGMSKEAIRPILDQLGLISIEKEALESDALKSGGIYGLRINHPLVNNIKLLMDHKQRDEIQDNSKIVTSINGCDFSKFVQINSVKPAIIRKDKVANKDIEKILAKHVDSYDETPTDTEHDLIIIRQLLSLLLTHTSGTAITFNLPIKSKSRKASTPMFLMPELWSQTIFAMRKSNNKPRNVNKDAALNVHNPIWREFVKKLLETSFKFDKTGLAHSYPTPNERIYDKEFISKVKKLRNKAT
jgi:hypothetical protein